MDQQDESDRNALALWGLKSTKGKNKNEKESKLQTTLEAGVKHSKLKPYLKVAQNNIVSLNNN